MDSQRRKRRPAVEDSDDEKEVEMTADHRNRHRNLCG
jgi:hypothetical protein